MKNIRVMPKKPELPSIAAGVIIEYRNKEGKTCCGCMYIQRRMLSKRTKKRNQRLDLGFSGKVCISSVILNRGNRRLPQTIFIRKEIILSRHRAGPALITLYTNKNDTVDGKIWTPHATYIFLHTFPLCASFRNQKLNCSSNGRPGT